MAQAARLNLRLQKELKLLLTDPPPGAAFPLLCSSSSLTAIDAQIKGPEGTVYADGLFNVKIQIPERYPFQPPSVTFATPIYHPNIDTGGRICLDILNLPPKGAWQPSLNISTMLTSIGLLLSEPNPDDGLMCEASREFKYNRQAFDQKARSMTQKYAQPAATGSVCDTPFESHANPITLEVETTNHESKHDANESVVIHKKVISKKLSLECSGQTEKRDVSREGNDVSKNEVILSDYGNPMKAEKAVKDTVGECNQSQEKIYGSKGKLSLESLSQCQKKSDKDMENVVPDRCPSLKPQSIRVTSSGSMVQTGNNYKQGIYQSPDSKFVDENIGMRSKSPRQFGKKQQLGSSNTSQMTDEHTDKMVVSPQISAAQSHPNPLSKPFPVAPAADDSLKCQPNKDLTDGMGNGSTGTSRKKLCLAGRSLVANGLSQKKSDKDMENVVPNHCPSLKHENLPVPSSGSLVLQSGNSYKQGIHQSQDSKLSDDKIGVRSKWPCQFGNKQSSGSVNTSQTIDESNGETLGTSPSHSNVLSEHLPVALAAESVKSQPHRDVIDEKGNVSTGTSRKRLCLGGKKLSLGFRSSSEKPGKDGKENLAPQVSEHNDGRSRTAGVNASHTKYGMLPLQDNNSNTKSVSSYPSKPLLKQQQNLGWHEKQQSDQDYDGHITGAIKRKDASESAMPESEAVIVLDSESSDEERSKPPMSKSILARKRLGKWSIRT